MNNKALIIALILWSILSLVLNLLTNLVSDVLFPNIVAKSWQIVIALVVALLLSIPLSIYISVRTSTKEASETQTPTPASTTQVDDPKDVAPMPQIIVQLPAKGYSQFIGRDEYLGDVLAALREQNTKPMVSIDGMGGIGKTAMAREVAEQCKRENLFNSFVWIQGAKQSFPLSSGDKGTSALTFNTILDEISRQFGLLDNQKLKQSEKEARITLLLKSQRVLIVLDNLETAKESQDEIARQLKPLLIPSKVLITSRRRFKADLYAIHLDDLQPDDAVLFALQTARDRNIDRVASATSRELLQIAKTTGSPLALKLIVGQLESQPLKAVLDQIQKIRSPKKGSSEDEYLEFYRFIFADSWRLCSENSRNLLISMAHFAPNVGGTHDALKAASELPDDLLGQCIQELWRSSLLEIGESPNLKTLRYYLHALTQYFVMSDIVKVIK
jgi:hypothetical protein